MALNFYDAYINSLAQEPVNDWQGLNQAMVDDVWLDTSTVTTVQGQQVVGGNVYLDESVQLTSVINPTTGEALGDQIRKIIYKTYNTLDKWLGKYYQFDNYSWLTTNTDTKIGALDTAILRRCNNQLKWIDSTGTLYSWPCVFKRSISSTNLDYGSEGVAEVGSDTIIQVQLNIETSKIPFNQRFLFDGHAFQTKQINNHISTTYMELYLFETQIQPNDDLINNIANGGGEISPTTNEIKILPEIAKIFLNDTQTFTVYNYINGVANSDTFMITASGPTSGVNYVLTIVDGNNFTIENLTQTSTPLVISCVDNVTTTTKTMSILLGGRW